MAYEIKLHSFEGPLDLLLHLIDKAEVDIYDIPVTTITEQYMQYIYIMQEFQLGVASEFLVMAATLLAIKSKMLLPQKEEPSFQLALEVEEEYDPRDELVQRLLEYKKYKTLAEALKEKEVNQSKLYTRPAEDLTPYIGVKEKNPIGEVSLYDLVEALGKVINKSKREDTPITKVHRDEVSVKDRIREIKKMLAITGCIRFTELFSELPNRTEIVTSFMAILEMMRKHQIQCEQSVLFGDIVLRLDKKEGG